MNPRLDEVLQRFHRFRKLEAAFHEFCSEAAKELNPAKAQFGIEFEDRDTPHTCGMRVLGTECRVRFGVHKTVDGTMLGKLVFERAGSDGARVLTKLYFDSNGNAGDSPEGGARHYGMGRPAYDSWLVILLLGAFFADAYAEVD